MIVSQTDKGSGKWLHASATIGTFTPGQQQATARKGSLGELES